MFKFESYFEYINGETYTGGYVAYADKNNVLIAIREGYGVLKLNSGSIFKGEFKNNYANGQGEMITD